MSPRPDWWRPRLPPRSQLSPCRHDHHWWEDNQVVLCLVFNKPGWLFSMHSGSVDEQQECRSQLTWKPRCCKSPHSPSESPLPVNPLFCMNIDYRLAGRQSFGSTLSWLRQTSSTFSSLLKTTRNQLRLPPLVTNVWSNFTSQFPSLLYNDILFHQAA